MTLAAAEIEANGWVLAVTGDWGASGFADFALDPDGTPAVALTVVGEGFTRSGGAAVADHAATRTLVATKPVRLPYAPGMGTGLSFTAVLDETDNGDGTRTVRLALSDRVYDGESVTAVFAAGWRTGEAGGSVSVTNGSVRGYPLPIVRWAVPTFAPPPVGTKHRVEVIVASHFPRHFGASLNQAVAGVRFVASDGVHEASVWALEPVTSPLYEQALRCWSAELDLDGFGAGPVTVHWEVYPWVGKVRKSGSGHATGMAGDFSINAEVPLHVIHDPDRVAYPYKYVAVDAATGTSTAGDVTVSSDWASAKAGTRADSLSTALQALKLAKLKNNASAGNGFDTSGNSADYCVIGLLAGAQTIGNTSLTTSYLATTMGRVIVEGDPDDANPRANVVLHSRGDGVSPVSSKNVNYWFRSMSWELADGGSNGTSGGSMATTAGRVHLDNVTIRGEGGKESGQSRIVSCATTNVSYYISLTNVKLSDYGNGFDSAANRLGLVRGSEFSRPMPALVHAANRRILNSGAATSTGSALDSWGTVADIMLWQSEALRSTASLTTKTFASGDLTGGDPGTVLRLAVVNVVHERVANDNPRHYGIGESDYAQMQDSIWDGVTIIGNGINIHNSSNNTPKVDLAHVGNVFRNVAIGRQATKQDVFSEDGSLTGSFELLYGVGNSGFVTANATQDGAWKDHQHTFFGLHSLANTGTSGDVEEANAWFGFEDFEAYQFQKSADATAGGGDYRAADGSLLRSLGAISTIDVDLDGELRGTLFAAGAYGAAEEAGSAWELEPDNAFQVQWADAAGLVVAREEEPGEEEPSEPLPATDLVPADGRSAMTGEGTVVRLLRSARRWPWARDMIVDQR